MHALRGASRRMGRPSARCVLREPTQVMQEAAHARSATRGRLQGYRALHRVLSARTTRIRAARRCVMHLREAA